MLEFFCIERSFLGLVFGVLVAMWRGCRWWLLGLFVYELCVCVLALL